ncbi:MAG TPA: serine hydrolase [Gemmatimonadales bacterium]|nr:serine hydrolase [Gemmatimonadales bacterium]
MIASIVLAVLGMSSAIDAQVPGDSSSRIPALVAERVARGAAVGLIVGTIEAGRPRLVVAGRRAEADARPLDGRTIVEIGSVSKVFTTTLLADMVLRGEVRLDDPVQRFLPATVRVPERNGRAITLLDLATSTSGLPRLPELRPADATNPYADFRADQLYAFLSNHALRRDPGAQYEYSNLGMGLLGHALALRAGTSYERLVQERLLRPLGMRDTRIVLDAAQRARFTGGHAADFDPVGHWDFDVLAGAGGWRSTGDDMMRLLAAAVAPPNSSVGRALAFAIDSQRPTGTPNLAIGLGWHRLTRGGRTIVWHNGETGGFHSFLGFDPVTGANALVLANTAADIDDLGLHLIDSSVRLRALPPPRTAVPLDSTALARLTGRYELGPGFEIAVTRSGPALYAQATGQSRFRIFASSPTRFFFRVVDAELSFQQDSGGRTTGLTLHQGGRDSPGRRLGP